MPSKPKAAPQADTTMLPAEPAGIAPPATDHVAQNVLAAQRRLALLLNEVTLRMKRQMLTLRKTDPTGSKLPKDPLFLKYGRWAGNMLIDLERINVQREALALKRKDPEGTPEDDARLAAEAVAGLPLEEQAKIMKQVRAAMEEEELVQRAIGSAGDVE